MLRQYLGSDVIWIDYASIEKTWEFVELNVANCLTVSQHCFLVSIFVKYSNPRRIASSPENGISASLPMLRRFCTNEHSQVRRCSWLVPCDSIVGMAACYTVIDIRQLILGGPPYQRRGQHVNSDISGVERSATPYFWVCTVPHESNPILEGQSQVTKSGGSNLGCAATFARLSSWQFCDRSTSLLFLWLRVIINARNRSCERWKAWAFSF